MLGSLRCIGGICGFQLRLELVEILADRRSVFVWLLVGRDEPVWAGLLLGVIGSTDWVDGYLARRLDQVSEVGKILDPLADRIAVATAVMTLLVLIFCEVLPKAAAARHPRRIAFLVALPIYIFHQLLRPVHLLFDRIVEPVSRPREFPYAG